MPADVSRRPGERRDRRELSLRRRDVRGQTVARLAMERDHRPCISDDRSDHQHERHAHNAARVPTGERR